MIVGPTDRTVAARMRIHTLDLEFQGVPGVIGSFLVEAGGELALVDTGPGSCHSMLLKRLGELKIRPEDVRKVFVTHIHLDHAGGAGWWAAEHGAQIYCHERAAPHLIDPTRLLNSARMIYEDRMDDLWGETVKAPKGKVIALGDGESVSLGDTQLAAWDTPGHARHHHAFVVDKVCFAGDAAGVKLEDSGYISVAAAPPQFDPVAYAKTLARLKAANFDTLYLTHFGEVREVSTHLDTYVARIHQCHQYVAALREEGQSADELALLYVNGEHDLALLQGVSEADWQRYELANGAAMCAAGIDLYLSKL